MSWQWHRPQVDELNLLNNHDRFSNVRNALAQISGERDEYAGIPMPIEGERLVISERFDFAKALSAINHKEEEDDQKARSIFYSVHKRCDIVTFEDKDGKVRHGVLPAMHHLAHDLQTLGCAVAWGIEQEHHALQLLGKLIRHHAFKTYLLTGMFLETSSKSGVTYLFRKLKPTVALKNERILCAMCMHPIAYYSGSWAGAMCPTDDVLAHLTLMRGDEHLFWKRCNQHAPHRPEAGI